MKKILFAIMIISAVIMTSGCTKDNHISGNFDRQFNRPAGERPEWRTNFTEEQKLEMQKSREDACENKSENDPCALTSPRGKMPGTCKKTEETLACAPDMQERQRRELP